MAFLFMGHSVYILYSEKLARFYTGMTEDLAQRLEHHNHPIDPIRFTARGIPWEIFLSLPCQSKAHALRLEKFIKSQKSKVYIQNLKKYPELVNKIVDQTAPDC